jgi:hypothetical protein
MHKHDVDMDMGMYMDMDICMHGYMVWAGGMEDLKMGFLVQRVWLNGKYPCVIMAFARVRTCVVWSRSEVM